jgi:nucleoside recognition membrane protein YjiH
LNEPQDNIATPEDLKVGLKGYVSLVVAIIFFSGVLASSKGWITALDFSTITGVFGTIKGETRAYTFLGAGGTGARFAFMFGLSLVPAVMLALGCIEIFTHLGALRAAQKLLTVILRPVLGIPGACALTLVTALQSTDAAAIMTKQLRDTSITNERERIILIAWQYPASGIMVNYFASGAALFAALAVPISLPLAVIIIMKFVGANLVRLYLAFFHKEADLNE